MMYAGDEYYGDEITSGGTYPQPAPQPPIEQLMEWMDVDGGCETLDGCWVESDGRCEHGSPSWLIHLGLI